MEENPYQSPVNAPPAESARAKPAFKLRDSWAHLVFAVGILVVAVFVPLFFMFLSWLTEVFR